eukprot:2750966-Amphidinium_carterae.1
MDSTSFGVPIRFCHCTLVTLQNLMPPTLSGCAAALITKTHIHRLHACGTILCICRRCEC